MVLEKEVGSGGQAAHLLRSGQTVLCCAQDAADEAELLQSELGCFRALLFLEEAADGQPSTAACGSEEKEQEVVRLGLLICFLNWKLHILGKERGEGKAEFGPNKPTYESVPIDLTLTIICLNSQTIRNRKKCFQK